VEGTGKLATAGFSIEGNHHDFAKEEKGRLNSIRGDEENRENNFNVLEGEDLRN